MTKSTAVRCRACRLEPRITRLRRQLCATGSLQIQIVTPARARDKAFYADPRNSLRERRQGPSTGARTPDGPRPRRWVLLIVVFTSRWPKSSWVVLETPMMDVDVVIYPHAIDPLSSSAALTRAQASRRCSISIGRHGVAATATASFPAKPETSVTDARIPASPGAFARAVLAAANAGLSSSRHVSVRCFRSRTAPTLLR